MSGMDDQPVGDILDFIRRQLDAEATELDEDERVALVATAGPWRYDPTKHHRKPGTVEFSEGVFTGASGRDATCIAVTGETDDPQSTADATHIARWDPARVLRLVEQGRREIDAKRQMLNEHRTYGGYGEHCSTCQDPGDDLAAGVPWPCPTLRLIAVPFAGRDGWQEQWRL